ncbi:hypothetical protein SDC9_151938 [bioreactor metagenome]|uniref:Uncharacterized protein n=1 Tax=bioreactor metagenome TaxID=1076179 RepID=A0A645EW15_9ZZZZ
MPNPRSLYTKLKRLSNDSLFVGKALGKGLIF